jgi:hypothetical protein
MSDMREVRLKDGIVTFDGRVLEFFGQESPSRRFHMGNVEELKRSGSTLEVRIRGGSSWSYDLETDDDVGLEALLAEAEQARVMGGSA